MDRATYRVRDAWATSSVTAALPNGAAVTQTGGIDLGPLSARGARFLEVELELIAPALTAARLPDAQTVTYAIETDNDAAFGSPVVVADAVMIQTGAGGVGAVGQTVRHRISTACERYVRLRATKVGAADASGASMTARLLH